MNVAQGNVHMKERSSGNRMKGIFMKKNDELYLLIGKVDSIEDYGDSFHVLVSYDRLNRGTRQYERLSTRIVFRDQEQRDDGKLPYCWAKWAREKKITPNCVIAVVVRFPNEDLTEANGYAVHYNGIIGFGVDDLNQKPRHAVGGMVTWMADKVDVNGKPYLSIGVSAGRDRYKNSISTIIRVRDPKLMEQCKKQLAVREDGTKSIAWFKCGDVFVYTSRDLVEQTMYTAFDMVKIGTYKNPRQGS